MKQPTFCRALFMAALLVGNASGVAWADGTETLGPPTGITISPGSNFVTAATGMEAEPGTINLNVPAGAVVKQALLYWNCRGTSPDNTITVDGGNVAGTQIGGPSPADLIPSGTQATSFRADITGLGLIAPGPNTLTVEDLDCGFRDSGVGALVIFDDGLGRAFSGRATVARVTAAGLVNVRLVDTGPLPSSGGFLDEELLNLNLPGILQSGTATAVTVGAGDQSQSAASVERLTLSLLGLLNLQAGVIKSNAAATCNAAGRASIQGASTLLNLTLNGNPIVISGAPNQTINLNLGLAQVRVVINEQVGSISGGGATGDLTVNALHVTIRLLGITWADVVLSSSHADIGCTVESPANIQIRDGNDFAFVNFPPPGGVTVAQTFTFPSSTVGRSAKLALFVGDAEANRADVVEIKVGTLPVMRIVDNLRSADGLQFDSLTLPVNIPAGVTTVRVQLLSAQDSTSPLTDTPDSLTWTLAALHVPTTQAPRNSFSGRAIGVKASALDPLVNLTVGDTGPLPSSGGLLEETLVDVNVPGLVRSKTIDLSTAGAGSQSQSEAVIEDLNLGPVLGLVVDATLIKSTATATCNAQKQASVSGSSQLVDLLLLGTPVVVTGQPNQTIPLNLGPLSVTVIVNEQITTVSGNTGDITVNALHVIATLDLAS